MKRVVLVIIMTWLLLTTGCGSQEEPARGAPPGTGPKAAAESQEAIKAARPSKAREHEASQQQLEDQLADFQKKLEEFQAKAQQAVPEARAKLEEQVGTLRKKAAKARQELGQLKTASGQAWEDLKAKVDKTMTELQEAYENAKSPSK